jgi:hypothetical protein
MLAHHLVRRVPRSGILFARFRDRLRRLQACAPLCACALVLALSAAGGPANAHGIAGNRVFPARLRSKTPP